MPLLVRLSSRSLKPSGHALEGGIRSAPPEDNTYKAQANISSVPVGRSRRPGSFRFYTTTDGFLSQQAFLLSNIEKFVDDQENCR